MHHTVVSQWYHARMTGLSKSSCICSYIMPSLVFRIKASTQWALGRDCRYIEGAARHTWRTGSWSPKEYTNRGRGTGSAHWLLDRHIHLLMLDSLLLRIERFWADIGESMYWSETIFKMVLPSEELTQDMVFDSAQLQGSLHPYCLFPVFLWMNCLLGHVFDTAELSEWERVV